MKVRALTLAAALVIPAAAAWAVDGTALYEKKCKTCHSIGGVAGPMAKTGGALDGVGAKRDATWLREYFKDPKSKIPESKFPKLTLSDEEWEALVAYMLTLK
ncbi:MAG: cytochrome c [Deltaproteobacteria bacterium]|nr:cytochrome c [Deltaproteobacteria bacterium]